MLGRLRFRLPHKFATFDMVINDELRLRNMDTLKSTCKNDSIDAAQNAPPHHTKTRKYKAAQTQTAIETATSLSEEIDTAEIEEKDWVDTWTEAQMKPWNG